MHPGEVCLHALGLIVVLVDLGHMTGDKIACSLGERLVVFDEGTNTKCIETGHGTEPCYEKNMLQVMPEGCV